jgi:exonuclease III
MPKFLFWNLNKSERRDLICRLARLENVDVIILAESALHTARFLEEINDAPQHFHYVPGECGHISLFTRFQSSLFPPILESHRISIRRLDLPARAKVTVVSAHLPSKREFGEDDQIFESVHLARLIEQAELHEGHQRTIVIGDLNMNPFESDQSGDPLPIRQPPTNLYRRPKKNHSAARTTHRVGSSQFRCPVTRS